MTEATSMDRLAMATELTVAWLANPQTRTTVDDVPAFLRSVHEALGALTTSRAEAPASGPAEEYKPAVSVRKSLANPDVIVSMIDGKPYRSLKRHLSGHNLTPEQYRARYGLKPDYPMIAPGYSEARRKAAKKIGLGRKSAAAGAAVTKAAATVAKKTRRTGAAALKAARDALGTE